MPKDKVLRNTATSLLMFGLIAGQVPAYADQSSEVAAPNEPQPLIAQASGSPPVHVRATQEANPGGVLSGHIEDNVESLTKDILRDEVKLQRFNLLFRSNAAKQGRWKGMRYFTFQESSILSVMSAEIVTIAENGNHLYSPPSPQNFLAVDTHVARYGGSLPAILGGDIGGTGDAIELALNTGHAIAAQRHGYGSKEARRTAVKLVSDIDNKIAAREKLIKELPASDKETAEMQGLEGTVLQDFRNSAVAEFERYHLSAKKTLVQQNSFYCLDILRQALGNVAGFMVIDLFNTSNPHPINTFVPCAITQGALTMLDPMFSRIAGKMALKADKKNNEKAGLATVFDNPDKLEKDYRALTSFCANHQVGERPETAGVVSRLDAFDANHAFITGELQRNARALRRGNRTAIQNMGMASFVGLSKITQACVIAPAGSTHIIDSGLHDVGVGNALVFAGCTAYVPSLLCASLDNLRVNLGNEFRRARLKKNHELPGQIIHDRLAKLDQIEKKI
jgi:hypothetical protein